MSCNSIDQEIRAAERAGDHARVQHLRRRAGFDQAAIEEAKELLKECSGNDYTYYELDSEALEELALGVAEARRFRANRSLDIHDLDVRVTLAMLGGDLLEGRVYDVGRHVRRWITERRRRRAKEWLSQQDLRCRHPGKIWILEGEPLSRPEIASRLRVRSNDDLGTPVTHDLLRDYFNRVKFAGVKAWCEEEEKNGWGR